MAALVLRSALLPHLAVTPRQTLLAISVLAWMMLALPGTRAAMPTLCTGAALWSVPPAGSLEVTVALLGADRLVIGWAVMIAAMMLPLQLDLIDYLNERSLRSRRFGMLAVGGIGYMLVWLAASLVLVPAALLLRLGAVHWLAAVLPALALALAWQVAPQRQAALNACHRLPPFAAFGWRGYRDAAAIGCARAGWCFLSCWAIMLLLLVIPAGHLAGMTLATLYLAVERAERPRPPRWGWVWPERAARALAHRITALRFGGVKRS